MKKLAISLLILSGFFAGCSQTAEYNKNLEVKDTSHNIAVKNHYKKHIFIWMLQHLVRKVSNQAHL